MREYYHDIITAKSWQVLQNLQRRFSFILIGGWAVYLYCHTLKSKDVDIVVSHETLSQLKENFELIKNDRWRKYEARDQEVDIDIYLEYYSQPGLPAEDIGQSVTALEGFRVPVLEVLLLLKFQAWRERRGSAKGEKDKIDLVALLQQGVDWPQYQRLLAKYNQGHLLPELAELLKSLRRVPELALNEHQVARLKRDWLDKLK